MPDLSSFAQLAGQGYETFAASVRVVGAALPWLLQGGLVTIATIAAAMSLGLVLGVPFAVAQTYGPPPLRRLVGLYVWFFRGVPILVLLYLFYFGLIFQLGLDMAPFTAAALVLGLTSAAYQSQIFRGAILSLPVGQMKAARALGMSTGTAIRCIILPQSLRLSIPGWSNEYSILLKDSALVSVVGILDIMARAKNQASSTSEYVAFYAAAAALYFFITFIGVRLLRYAERALRIPGYTPQ